MKFADKEPLDLKADKSSQSYYDPHKLCALESEQKKMKEELHEYKHMVREFEKELKKKLENFEIKLIQSLSQMKQDDNKFSSLKEEILSYFDKTQGNLMEKLKNQGKEIEDLWRKIAPFSDFDKKLKKLSQKLDLDQIFKLLGEKAEEKAIRKEFELFDEKFKGINELFNQMRREYEKIEGFYQEFSAMMQTNPQETVTTFIGNNSVTKSRCLCCGIKGKNTNYSLYGQNHVELKGF